MGLVSSEGARPQAELVVRLWWAGVVLSIGENPKLTWEEPCQWVKTCISFQTYNRYNVNLFLVQSPFWCCFITKTDNNLLNSNIFYILKVRFIQLVLSGIFQGKGGQPLIANWPDTTEHHNMQKTMKLVNKPHMFMIFSLCCLSFPCK